MESLFDAVGPRGLIGMPGFSSDASFPPDLARPDLSQTQIHQIERAVPGFDIQTSPTSGMGALAETFRTWPGTRRSAHPTVSICLNGPDAEGYLRDHSLDWATGPETPLGRLCQRERMKILLIGVGWNRCSALHTAETRAPHRRTKTRRFKLGGAKGTWVETPDVADDRNRLFPALGQAYEATGAVTMGRVGDAPCKLCDFPSLVDFATGWIDQANRQSGVRS